jgi:hypothetical protein
MVRERIDATQAEVVTLQKQLATAEAEGAASDIETAGLTAQVKRVRAEAQAAVQAVDDLRLAAMRRGGRQASG